MELATNSASSSPTTLSFSSPTIGLTTVPSVSELNQEEQRSSQSSSEIDDFEFKTIQKFEILLHQNYKQEEEKPQHGQVLPLMSFADELFSNGQVLPSKLPPHQVRPLKLPPRLQYVSDGKINNRSSITSSPMSPSSVLKGPFRHWSFTSIDVDDFDPFTVALENVRKEARPRGRDGRTSHKRSQSFSPLRTTPQCSNYNDLLEVQHYNKQVGLQQPSSSVRPVKPTLTTLPGPKVDRSELRSKSAPKSGESNHKGCSGLGIKEFLFRSASEGRADSKDKLRPHTAAVRKGRLLRNLSFKSMHETHYSSKKELKQEMRKKTLIPYKAPCFLVCLGFGPRGLRNLS